MYEKKEAVPGAKYAYILHGLPRQQSPWKTMYTAYFAWNMPPQPPQCPPIKIDGVTRLKKTISNVGFMCAERNHSACFVDPDF